MFGSTSICTNINVQVNASEILVMGRCILSFFVCVCCYSDVLYFILHSIHHPLTTCFYFFVPLFLSARNMGGKLAAFKHGKHNNMSLCLFEFYVDALFLSLLELFRMVMR